MGIVANEEKITNYNRQYLILLLFSLVEIDYPEFSDEMADLYDEIICLQRSADRYNKIIEAL